MPAVFMGFCRLKWNISQLQTLTFLLTHVENICVHAHTQMIHPDLVSSHKETQIHKTQTDVREFQMLF